MQRSRLQEDGARGVTCACRRSLSEEDLIAAYGGDAPTPQNHSEPHFDVYDNVDAAASRALLVARRQRAESAAALSRAAEQRARAAFRLVKT